MKFGNSEVLLLSDGSFTLDPGAYFGIVPRPLWAKNFTTNNNQRVKLSLNIPLIQSEDFTAIIDSGIGTAPDERIMRNFEVSKDEDLVEQLRTHVSPEKIDLIVQSHLHFDHFGHSLEMIEDRWLFKNATIVAQRDEFASYRRPNEFTKGNYGIRNLELLRRARKTGIQGSTRIRHNLNAVRTGGHTKGHQVIIYKSGDKELIYFGDLIPSAFHLKIPYLTAIDSFPLETVLMKKKLIEKAIKDRAICIFNHDSRVPSAILSGTSREVTVEAVDLSS